jgi:glycosyltransferase involved in cell wall biosynthesis
MPRICIVSHGTLTAGPRVLKEADALNEAGYDVRVVGLQTLARHVAWDRDLMRERTWRFDAVRVDPGALRPLARRYSTGLSQRMFGRAFAAGAEVDSIAARALSRGYRAILRLSLSRPADLFIGHNAAALPVIAEVARRWDVPIAFDAEDDHVGDYSQTRQAEPGARLIDFVQKRILPRCTYVSAASPGIAQNLVERYGVSPPRVVHNVFPVADRRRLDGRRIDRTGPASKDSVSLYWYSQVIGIDRGLQDVIRACQGLRGMYELHLRGDTNPPQQAELQRLAEHCGVAQHIRFHPQVSPLELLSRSAEHDVGLALEQPISTNRLQTVTNKFFNYMMAGLAVVATRTPGQDRVLRECPGAGFMYEPGDCNGLRAILQRLIDDRALLAAAKQAALDAALQRWNWESESATLLSLIAERLGWRPWL